MKVISPIGARTERGPASWYRAGNRSCHTFGGSITWSSTEMILGKSSIRRSVPPDLTACQEGGSRRQ
jgi:hypothetical protein